MRVIEITYSIPTVLGLNGKDIIHTERLHVSDEASNWLALQQPGILEWRFIDDPDDTEQIIQFLKDQSFDPRNYEEVGKFLFRYFQDSTNFTVSQFINRYNLQGVTESYKNRSLLQLPMIEDWKDTVQDYTIEKFTENLKWASLQCNGGHHGFFDFLVKFFN